MKITVILQQKQAPGAIEKIYNLPAIPHVGELLEVYTGGGYETINEVMWHRNGTVSIQVIVQYPNDLNQD